MDDRQSPQAPEGWDAAFRPGDTAGLTTARTNLSSGIREAKKEINTVRKNLHNSSATKMHTVCGAVFKPLLTTSLPKYPVRMTPHC